MDENGKKIKKGQQIYEFCKKIFPYCRSITGEGVHMTLSDIADYIERDGALELCISEVRSGKSVFDWTVPKEWSIREAYIEDESGKRIIDMKENNLHVMGYSVPVDRWVDLAELKKYIYVQDDQPDAIPYVTSYYKERYGFCMSKNQRDALPEGKYHMVIDSDLFEGVLNYAETVIPGESKKEIFFSTYFCHPSMANNECSGPALAAELIRYVLAMKNRRYTYRFLFIPETIGSITYLATGNHLADRKKTMIAGFNLSCVGDDRAYSMICSRKGNTLPDRVLHHVLKGKKNYIQYSFLKRGSDERQYNSPGIDLPVVCFCRSKFGEYPEYHTSLDNMDLVSPEGFQGSFDVMTEVIQALEYNGYYKATVLGEPQFGKRGLYPEISKKGVYDGIFAMRDLLAYADGTLDLIEISETIDVPLKELIPLVDKMLMHGLIELSI